MSLTLSLTTSAERAAALAALTTYIEHLDGAPRIAPQDNPETGVVPIPVPVITEMIPSAGHAFAHTGGVAAPAVGVVGSGHAFAPPPYLEAPVPPAPSATPLPNTPMPDLDVDSKGVPWNPELHAGNKSKNKDGSWRAKRNSGDAPEAPPAPPAAAPVAPPVAPVASAAPADFAAFMQRVMPAVTGGKISTAKLNEILGMCGVPNLPALGTMPAALPVVWQMVEPLLA